jgi:LytS/YehU family sensor histidine kinase
MPTLISIPQEHQDPYHTLLHLALPITMCITFYLNYCWLTPKLFLKKKVKTYVLINVFMVVVMALVCQWAWHELHDISIGDVPFFKMLTFFVSKKMLSLSVPIVLATLLRMSLQRYHTEEIRKEDAIQRKEVELKNLRSQLNPHFLLNTLNNIYALIEFDQEKAKKAVISLSTLMRMMLYSKENEFVSLKEETQFLDNYINLMRLRLPQNVQLTVDYDIPDPCTIQISPLIFISLVENAFKHGISPTKNSFIDIRLKAEDDKILFKIVNSNYPKSDSDNSGHGIGLEQVQRRLDIIYPGKYEWKKGVDKKNKTYSSQITIYDTKMCHH